MSIMTVLICFVLAISVLHMLHNFLDIQTLPLSALIKQKKKLKMNKF